MPALRSPSMPPYSRNSQQDKAADTNARLITLTTTHLLVLLSLVIFTSFNVGSTIRNANLLTQLRPLPEKQYSYIDKDYPAQLPLYLPEVGVELKDAAPDFAIMADDEWGTLFPERGSGFTMLGSTNKSFIPTMYHQLHCLDVMRVEWARATIVKKSKQADGDDTDPKAPGGENAQHHFVHCLRYLKQGIMCNADTTLEEAVERVNPDGTITHGANGVDMVHRCRDWGVLRSWLDVHGEL